VLIINGDHRQAFAVADVAGERLKVGDYQINAFFVDQMRERLQATRGARRFDQVAGQRSLVAHAVVHVSQAEPEDFFHREALTQVAQPAVK